MVRTKIEINPNIARNISGLDDLARIIFPDNQDHRRVFVAVWVELKYAEDQFLPSFSGLCSKYDISERVLETIRSRMKKIGILKRVSHFNPYYGHSSGWTFSEHFSGCLIKLSNTLKSAKTPTGRPTDEQKDRDSMIYV